MSITSVVKDEQLYATFKVLVDEGYLKVAKNSFGKNKMADTDKNQDEQENADTSLIESLKSLKKGSPISFKEFNIKEGRNIDHLSVTIRVQLFLLWKMQGS